VVYTHVFIVLESSQSIPKLSGKIKLTSREMANLHHKLHFQESRGRIIKCLGEKNTTKHNPDPKKPPNNNNNKPQTKIK